MHESYLKLMTVWSQQKKFFGFNVLIHTVHYQALAVSLEVAYNTKFIEQLIIINTFCSTQSHACQNLKVWSNLSLSMLWITMSNKLNRSNRMHFIKIKLNMHIHRNDLGQSIDFLPGLTKRSHIPFIRPCAFSSIAACPEWTHTNSGCKR